MNFEGTKYRCCYCDQVFFRNAFSRDRDLKRNIMYCSPHCQNKSLRRTMAKTIDYKCKTCGSLVRGTSFTKTRKHCTDRCKEVFGNKKSTSQIKLKVDLIKPSKELL